MKNLLWIVIGAFIVVSFFIGKSCNKPEQFPPDLRRITALEDSLKLSQGRENALRVQDDSLKTAIEALRAQKPPQNTQIASIDSNIAKDSAKAVLEARKQLIELEIPVTLSLKPFNYYEYANTARLLSDIKPLRLENHWLHKLDSLNTTDLRVKDNRINELTFISKGKDEVIELTKNSVNYYKGLYDDTQGFFYDRFNLSLSVGAFYNGYNVYAGVGVTAGISLWKSE